MGCCYLQAELCGLLPEELDLFLAVSLHLSYVVRIAELLT